MAQFYCSFFYALILKIRIGAFMGNQTIPEFKHCLKNISNICICRKHFPILNVFFCNTNLKWKHNMHWNKIDFQSGSATDRATV